jgi:uncharacterized phage protein gp47/JayE
MPDEYDYPYEPPEFLQDQSADEIHERMLENLPDDIDTSQGNIPWDFTRPSALEKAEFVEFTLNETIKLIFPQWAYDEWLDYHGEKVNCIRKPANPASGTLSVTGVVGTVIPSGYQFATPADLTESVIFETVEPHVLEGEPDGSGQVTNEVTVQATDGGLFGNVAADTIKLMVNPMNGISHLANHEPMTGGTEREADGEYVIRILDAMRSGSSMTGCNADYVRWGKEVAAVGQVIVDPEWNDPDLPEAFHYKDRQGNDRCAGAVRLIIIDSNGLPANRQILDAVYLHIAGTNDYDPARLMPVGAHLTVEAPEGIDVDIAATVLLDDGEDIATITKRFRENLAGYWLQVGNEATNDYMEHTGCIRWVQVGAVLAKTAGVKDYTGLTVNGGMGNIAITQTQYPVTGEVELNVQT